MNGEAEEPGQSSFTLPTKKRKRPGMRGPGDDERDEASDWDMTDTRHARRNDSGMVCKRAVALQIEGISVPILYATRVVAWPYMQYVTIVAFCAARMSTQISRQVRLVSVA